MFWSDFDRINETHFWSMHKNLFIEPEVVTGLGRRNGLELNVNFYQLWSKANREYQIVEFQFRRLQKHYR